MTHELVLVAHELVLVAHDCSPAIEGQGQSGDIWLVGHKSSAGGLLKLCNYCPQAG